MDFQDGKGFKEKPLPRYYRDYIFNPILKIDEKKDYYRSIGLVPTKEMLKRQIRKFRESDDDYESSFIYKKRLIRFSRNVQEYLDTKTYIDKVGEEAYYKEREAYLSVKSQNYMFNVSKYLAGISKREPEFM